MRHNHLFVMSLLALSLALTGAGCWSGSNPVAEKAKETFTSIKDAVDRSITLKCEYTDESGEKTVAYIKGKQIRMDSATEGDQGFFHGIIRDDKMWIWADKIPEGMMLDFAKVTDDSLMMGDKVIRSQDDILAKFEEKKDTCKQESVADSQFTLPENVKFTDVQSEAANAAPPAEAATTSTVK